MTTEEKAKAYDEAIIIAKSCLEKGVNPANNPLDYFIGCVCKMFPSSFPELRESEDERIRTFLHYTFTAQYLCKDKTGKWHGEPVTNILSYLEKQKEQKPTAEEVLIKAGLKPYKDGNQWCILVGDNIQEGICGFGDTIEDAFYQFLLEILEELKPAECIEDSVKYEEGFKAGRESGLRDGQRYVLDNLDSYGLCKPAEWSEEDETRLTNILIMLKEYVIHHYSKDDVNKSVDWLENRVKFLRSTYKPLCSSWKPSEQEKGALRTAIYILTNERNSPKAAAHLQNILDAFEGEEPRKEWKPSPLQLKVLELAANDNLLSCEELDMLNRLYEQLKKL